MNKECIGEHGYKEFNYLVGESQKKRHFIGQGAVVPNNLSATTVVSLVKVLKLRSP